MSTPAEESDKPQEAQPSRSSSRERALTEKGLKLREQQAKKNEKEFSNARATPPAEAPRIASKRREEKAVSFRRPC